MPGRKWQNSILFASKSTFLFQQIFTVMLHLLRLKHAQTTVEVNLCHSYQLSPPFQSKLTIFDNPISLK